MPQIAIAAAVMAAAAAAKHYAVDKPNADKQLKLASKTQEFSPWTGLQAKVPNPTSAVGDIMSGAVSGAQMGQGLQNAQAQQGLLDAQTKYLNGGGSPGTTAAMSQTDSPYGGLGFNKSFYDTSGVGGQ